MNRRKKETKHSTKLFSHLDLKPDHETRPIWVCGQGPAHVFLETFSPIYKQTYDFLIAIAEPLCRPSHVHEYAITDFSLYAAASVNLRTDDIIDGLDRLSKCILDPKLIQYIKEHTASCGKVKFVLRDSRYYLESVYPQCLETLLSIDVIKAARLMPSVKDLETHSTVDTVHGPIIKKKQSVMESLMIGKNKVNQNLAMGLEDLKTDEVADSVYMVEVKQSSIEPVRRECVEAGFPTLEEYDFRNDQQTPELPISLRASAQIRPYQEKSLSKMFGNGRARSGLIVLPCGSGKTLVGITAAATIKKATIVFATTGVSCGQWKEQFKLWSTIPPRKICQFTSNTKDALPRDNGPAVLITTYNMVSYTGKRSKDAEKMINQIQSREWGLILFDEVHVAPANMFRKCINIIKSRCKLGLTATLVREDDLISDLNFLIGPKLYEANWLSLQRSGFIATVECLEIWCPMSPLFFKQYLKEDAGTSSKSKLLYIMNPNKFRACEYLVRVHEQKGDKVLVFSDNIFALEYYAKAMKRPYIYGKTNEHERKRTLSYFQSSSDMNTIFISKVGDCSIDLPDVNVIIQISSHYSSRRQEAQRLGRILRPKSRTGERAYFYTLVSRDTREMIYSTKRRRFLVDQGYSFHVLPEVLTLDEPGFMFGTVEERKKLLLTIMSQDDTAGDVEEIEDGDYDASFKNRHNSKRGGKRSRASRKRGSTSSLSTGGNGVYGERQKRSSMKSKHKKSRKKKKTWDEIQKDDIKQKLHLPPGCYD